MSAATRQALADAASSVEGVTCSPYNTQATRPGDAMVRLDVATADDSGFGYMVAWQVLIILTQDVPAAERWIDAHLDALLDALRDEGHVTSAQPVQLVLDTGTVPALNITLSRAKD